MRLRQRAWMVVWIVLGGGLAGCVDGATEVGTDPGPVTDPFESDTAPDLDALLSGLVMDTALARISPGDLTGHIGALAHDSMKGRRTGRPELEDAAAYIAGALADAGVAAAGPEGYLARWDFMPPPSTLVIDSLGTRPPNVVGVVPGSDPELADSYVVVTAHYDHLGTRSPYTAGDSIFNGADDNASGTAVLLEVAEAMAALPVAPRRSILFVAVSGEELGLLGSAEFVHDPVVPLASMVANVNLDMVSRGPSATVFVIGYGLSTLGQFARAVTDQFPGLGLHAESDITLGSDLIARSDHYHFARNRIPAVGLFTGLHPEYHRVSDELSTVDAHKAARVARLAAYLVAAVATLPETPAWTTFGESYMERYW